MSSMSAVIIARNEEAVIGRCIGSLKGLVNEIVLVDSGSTDQTVDLASGLGARIIKTEWKGFGANKNLGNEYASGDWIFSIDADEWVDESLKTGFHTRSLKPDTVYCLRRINYVEGKAVYYGPYRPELKVRLFQKGTARWDDKEVHEELVFNPSSSTARLKGHLGHQLAESFEELARREDHYARLSATHWHRIGKHPNFIKRHLGGPYHFLKAYLAHGGFMAGIRGWKMSSLQSYKHQKKIAWYDAFGTRENPDILHR